MNLCDPFLMGSPSNFIILLPRAAFLMDSWRLLCANSVTKALTSLRTFSRVSLRPHLGQENTLSLFPSAGPSIGTRQSPQRMLWVSVVISRVLSWTNDRLDLHTRRWQKPTVNSQISTGQRWLSFKAHRCSDLCAFSLSDSELRVHAATTSRLVSIWCNKMCTLKPPAANIPSSCGLQARPLHLTP